jgi:hypothetical protein
METVRSEGDVIEPLVPWLGQNVVRLAFYLLIASLVSAVLSSWFSILPSRRVTSYG